MKAKCLLIFIAVLICSAASYPQNAPGRRGGSSSRLSSSKSGNKNKSDSKESTQQPDSIKPGSAWTLTFPLGNHVESTIDTLTYNFQRRSIPSMVTDAYATTGNLGAEGLDLIYFTRPERATFFFQDALDAWIPTFKSRNSTTCISPPRFFLIFPVETSSTIRTDSLLISPET